MPAPSPPSPHNSDPDHKADQDSPGAPVRRRSTRGQTWHVGHIDTVPMTAEQYDQAVSALAALIGQWQRHRDDDQDQE